MVRFSYYAAGDSDGVGGNQSDCLGMVAAPS